MQRDKLIDFVDSYLASGRVKDASKNGLQVAGAAEVRKVALGVSASLEFIKRAAAERADMIIVHHGLLWGGTDIIKGSFKAKLELLLKNDITLAAWHLPLDKHPVIGNNAQLMKFLGAGRLKPFGTYDGEAIGMRGAFTRPKPLSAIKKILAKRLDAEIRSFDFGSGKIRTLGVVSGGGQRMFEQAVDSGLDLFITGEASEFVQEMARENKINFIAAGHYNTEKTGVWALEKLLRSKFKLKTQFIDIPNPV